MAERVSRRRTFRFVVASASFILAAPPARADPQVSVGADIGVADVGLRQAPRSTDVHLGAIADVLFLRNRDTDMAVGPYAGVSTEAFHSIELGAGVEWLAPLIRGDLPFVLGVGALARRTSAFGWEPGVSGRLFFGSRDFNFHSAYGLAAGLFVEGRYGFGDGKQGDVIVGAQLDLALLALPFVLLFEAVAH